MWESLCDLLWIRDAANGLKSKPFRTHVMLPPRHSEGSGNKPDCTGTVVIGVEKPCKVRDIPLCYSCQRGSAVNEYKLMCQYASGTAE